MRRVVLLGCVLILAGAVNAQAGDSTIVPSSQSAPPTFNFDPATLPSVVRTPSLDMKPAARHESIFSGLDLGGSTLNFEGDRKPPDSLFGAEMLEPGTLMSRKSRKLGPNYFGLSIKKSLE